MITTEDLYHSLSHPSLAAAVTCKASVVNTSSMTITDVPNFINELGFKRAMLVMLRVAKSDGGSLSCAPSSLSSAGAARLPFCRFRCFLPCFDDFISNSTAATVAAMVAATVAFRGAGSSAAEAGDVYACRNTYGRASSSASSTQR